jgi:hypothetical protein
VLRRPRGARAGLCWSRQSVSRTRMDRQGQGRTRGGARRRTARVGLCRPRWQRAATPCAPTRLRQSWLGMERGHPGGLLTRGGPCRVLTGKRSQLRGTEEGTHPALAATAGGAANRHERHWRAPGDGRRG